VAGTATYAVPDDLYKGLRLTVSGRPYLLSNDEDAEYATRGDRGGGAPIFYETFDEDGVELYGLYPVPTDSDLTIALKYVFFPPDMDDDDDEPPVPENFHRAIAKYAQSVAMGEIEDDPEEETTGVVLFDRAVAELRSLRISRFGRDVAYMRISGIHT
jgi:hypothetical protein